MLTRCLDRVALRTPRPWLAMIACPLAVIAAGMLGLWPVVLISWALTFWWAPSTTAAVVSVQLGGLGIELNYAAVLLWTEWPTGHLVTALLWAGLPAGLATLSFHQRRPGRPPRPW